MDTTASKAAQRAVHLSEAEINDICAPLKQAAAQVRFLRDILKLKVQRRPDGRPLVGRTHFEAVMNGTIAHEGNAAHVDGPNWSKRR